MVLADLGADVIRIERVPAESDAVAYPPPGRALGRGVRSLAVDLKTPAGNRIVYRLILRSDVVIEGFRPGVVERLGLGPDDVATAERPLVFVRLTGWGQTGPRAQHAGHDINYLAGSGALSLIGRKGEPPVPPLNLVGDFGGGGMLGLVGALAGLIEARRSGKGQVVDVAMVDGVALLTTILHEWRHDGQWRDERGANFIDTGAPFYDVYPLADGGWLAIGAIEGRFWRALLQALALEDAWLIDGHHNRRHWPRIRERLATRLLELSPQDVEELAANPEACATRVLTLDQASMDEHNAARSLFIGVNGAKLPAPAPRFSRTPAPLPAPAEELGASTSDVLRELDYDESSVDELIRTGVVYASPRT